MIAIKQILIIIILFYLFFMLFLYLLQKSFIFFPTHAKHQLNENESKSFSITRNGATLSGWLINHKHASEQLIIYYGGNAEDIFFSIDEFRNYSDSATLLVNYRGYGASSGSPSEEAFFADALAIYDEVHKQFSPKRVILMGRSLGSGVASYVSAQRKVDGLILVTPFDSLESIAKKHYPYMPVSLLLKHKFPSVEYISALQAPSLIIYGGKDRTVPPASTKKLIEKIPGEKLVVFIEDAEHNNIELFDDYQLAILQFLQH